MPPLVLTTLHPQVRVCWGPEQWLLSPELGIRKQLCLLSWDPWGLDVGGGPPSRCCRLWQNLRPGKWIRGGSKRDWEWSAEGEGTRASAQPRPRYLRPLAGSPDGSEPQLDSGIETGSWVRGQVPQDPRCSRLPALVSLVSPGGDPICISPTSPGAGLA